MGVVYRAADSKLGREVAIKVLPKEFEKDAERLGRFEREARLLAALNHPNIAGIHGLEEAGGVHYLVLELVPGETLDQRLKRGPLEVAEALEICRQIAEALEAAHEKGIVHRDLKPANIKITPQAKVKVLDFGLAKAFEAAPDNDLSRSPTITDASLGGGRIVGTAAYMSPEQARGRPVDKRTDVWSFGCVLYETFARRRTFGGQTVSDSIAAVLSQEPDWQALPERTPGQVQTLLRRCLQKDPQRRLRDIGDARLELEEALARPTAAAPIPSTRVPRLRLALYGLACLVAGALAAGLAAWVSWRNALPSPPVARFTITLASGEVVPSTIGGGVALSPNGNNLAYLTSRAGKTQIYLRPLDQLEAKPIPGTEGAWGPVFSPDGQWLAFWQAFKWKKVPLPLCGGPPITMFDAPQGGSRFAAWGPDDTLTFGVYPAHDAGSFRRWHATGLECRRSQQKRALWRLSASPANRQDCAVRHQDFGHRLVR